MQGLDAQDQPRPFVHIRLAPHGRSMQLGRGPSASTDEVYSAPKSGRRPCSSQSGHRVPQWRGLTPSAMSAVNFGVRVASSSLCISRQPRQRLQQLLVAARPDCR
jgi:hypothetical protein